jgi:hypothetical protein
LPTLSSSRWLFGFAYSDFAAMRRECQGRCLSRASEIPDRRPRPFTSFRISSGGSQASRRAHLRQRKFSTNMMSLFDASTRATTSHSMAPCWSGEYVQSSTCSLSSIWIPCRKNCANGGAQNFRFPIPQIGSGSVSIPVLPGLPGERSSC